MIDAGKIWLRKLINFSEKSGGLCDATRENTYAIRNQP